MEMLLIPHSLYFFAILFQNINTIKSISKIKNTMNYYFTHQWQYTTKQETIAIIYR